MPRLRLAAPAKINLHLEILGRDAAGFHLLETVFQALDLADEVTVETAPGEPVTICTCDLPGLECGPGNLAVRAVEALRPHLPGLGSVRIHLAKRIPVGGGLGGGSSDAAAVLRAVDALAGPLPAATLRSVAASLGSDVPFFLVGGTAHGLGRGGDLTPLPVLPSQVVTLIFPPFGCPTPQVFAALTEAGVATVAVQGNPKAQVNPALVERGDVFADVVLPARTKLTPQLWAAVLTGEVEFLAKQGRTASVYASGAADILGFDWTLVFIIANFLGLLSLLYLLLWEPIVKVLDERSAQIEGDLKSARESRELAAALKKEYDALMLGAKQERQALIADGQKEGQNEKQRILAEARRDADKIIQQTRQELVAAAEKARRQLRAEIGGLSVELAGKILAREIREEDNRRLVDDFVTAIGGSERGN